MCVLRFGFVLFWRAGYGFIDANVNLLFVLCNNLYDNFINWLAKFGIKPKEKIDYSNIQQPSIKLQSENIIKNRCIDLLNLRIKIKDNNYIQNETDIRLIKQKLNKYMLDSNGINLLGYSINNEYFRIYFLFLKITLKINSLAWLIPIRKWRDKFREKFKMQIARRQDRTGHKPYLFLIQLVNNTIKIKKLQPTLLIAVWVFCCIKI